MLTKGLFFFWVMHWHFPLCELGLQLCLFSAGEMVLKGRKKKSLLTPSVPFFLLLQNPVLPTLLSVTQKLGKRSFSHFFSFYPKSITKIISSSLNFVILSDYWMTSPNLCEPGNMNWINLYLEDVAMLPKGYIHRMLSLWNWKGWIMESLPKSVSTMTWKVGFRSMKYKV